MLAHASCCFPNYDPKLQVTITSSHKIISPTCPKFVFHVHSLFDDHQQRNQPRMPQSDRAEHQFGGRPSATASTTTPVPPSTATTTAASVGRRRPNDFRR